MSGGVGTFLLFNLLTGIPLSTQTMKGFSGKVLSGMSYIRSVLIVIKDVLCVGVGVFLHTFSSELQRESYILFFQHELQQRLAQLTIYEENVSWLSLACYRQKLQE